MIRSITNNDTDSLYNLDQSSLKSNWSLLTYKAMIIDQNTIHYLFEEDNKIKGFIILMLNDDSADLMQLIVDKTYHKKRVATKLLDKVMIELKNKHIKTLYLEVEETNTKAINLYKKFKFKEIKKRTNYYGKNRHAIVMEKKV